MQQKNTLFRKFRGFHPEGRYAGFSDNDVIHTAKQILKSHTSEEIELTYYPNTVEGLAEKTRKLTVPADVRGIDKIFRNINETDRIEIAFKADAKMEGYILQKIVKGNYSVTEIDRTHMIFY